MKITLVILSLLLAIGWLADDARLRANRTHLTNDLTQIQEAYNRLNHSFVVSRTINEIDEKYFQNISEALIETISPQDKITEARDMLPPPWKEVISAPTYTKLSLDKKINLMCTWIGTRLDGDTVWLATLNYQKKMDDKKIINYQEWEETLSRNSMVHQNMSTASADQTNMDLANQIKTLNETIKNTSNQASMDALQNQIAQERTAMELEDANYLTRVHQINSSLQPIPSINLPQSIFHNYSVETPSGITPITVIDNP